jgi:hypothetical protein
VRLTFTAADVSTSNRRLCNLSTTSPLQKIVTAEKGVALDFERLSRDARSQSKELYQWGQQEHSDVKDGKYSIDDVIGPSPSCRSL